MNRLSILTPRYYQEYRVKKSITLATHYSKLSERYKNEMFSFYVSASAAYSAMIEGNTIDPDTYLRYSSSGINTESKFFCEIDDLIKSYIYATSHSLSYESFLQSHAIATVTLLENDKYLGALRDKEVYIYGNGVKIYTGAAPAILKEWMHKLFRDIDILLNRSLSITEVFYYASLIHLHLVLIHPFVDGNGRLARLLEKWFLAAKLGKPAWQIQSEQLYQNRIKSYYSNLNLGPDYGKANFDLCIRFLLMLPMALRLKS